MQPTEQLQLTQVEGKLRAERRATAQKSLKAFGSLYFPDHVRERNSRLHEELYPQLEQMIPGARIAVAAPRGSAKSTLVSLIFVLWSICTRRHRYIVLVSDTGEKASDFLSHIKDQLVQNSKLVADFPEVCEPGGKYPRWPRSRANEIIAHNGVKVTALGYGQNIRGKRHQQDRPDLIILDDVESRENTATLEVRSKVEDWFNTSILKAGTKDTQVIVVGTIQHYDALLAKLTDPVKNPFWKGRIYRSVIRWAEQSKLWEQWAAILRHIDPTMEGGGPEAARAYFESHRDEMLQGTEVLWPEREDYYMLMLMREAEGPASFDSEKQNEPVNPKDCFFLEEDFTFWDDHYESERELLSVVGQHAQFIGACDPSLGKQGRHADDSAIITLLRDSKTGTLYVLDADIARRKPDRIIEEVLTYARIRRYKRFGFEANQFQSFLADELRKSSKKSGLYLPIRDLTHTTDKIGRIQSLQPLVKSGCLQFSRRHKLLLEQLRLFPKAAHDDGPDALEMAVATARLFRSMSCDAFAITPDEDGGNRNREFEEASTDPDAFWVSLG